MRKPTLAPASWKQIEPELEWYSPSWDKCARLIRAAVRAFYERPWPIALFCVTFQTTEQFRRALAELGNMWRGRRFLRRLRAGVLDKSISANSEQSDLIMELDI